LSKVPETGVLSGIAQPSTLANQDETIAAASKIKETLLKLVIESYRDGYKELADAWRNLETKAQGNIAISGIFIGGVFAYIQKVDPQLQQNEKVLLGLAAFFLVVSVIFSVISLKVRTVPAPPLGGFVDKLVTDLLECAEDDGDLITRIPALCYDQISGWRDVEINVIESIRLKARNLKGAQIFLTVAILTVGLLTLLKIFY
jgi:hypothetical protein